MEREDTYHHSQVHKIKMQLEKCRYWTS